MTRIPNSQGPASHFASLEALHETRLGLTLAAMPHDAAPEIARLALPFTPRQALLFSGHMVDSPARASPRFPMRKVADAAHRIDQVLDTLNAGDRDVALCQAAAGGDLLFAQACLARGVHVQVLLPFDEPEFIERSVLPSEDGEVWRERYVALTARLPVPPLVMPRALGRSPVGADPFEQCNRWLLHSALALGTGSLRFICLWDGSGGDGPGGTAHMIEEVRRCGGEVAWIDTRTLQEQAAA